MRSGPPHSQINILMPSPLSRCILSLGARCVDFVSANVHSFFAARISATTKSGFSAVRNFNGCRCLEISSRRKSCCSTQFSFLFFKIALVARDKNCQARTSFARECALSTDKQPSISSFKKLLRETYIKYMLFVFFLRAHINTSD